MQITATYIAHKTTVIDYFPSFFIGESDDNKQKKFLSK